MIPFNYPCLTGHEKDSLLEVVMNNSFSGDGQFTKNCQFWLEKISKCKKALLTTSGTHALEMAAILCDIKPGDEVIMPSYTFSSTANAFVLRGARIVFIDILPDTMNLDESLIEAAISDKTKVIVPVHYAGVSCEMDTIMKLAEKYSLLVVEDAAQAILSKYKDRHLGTIGHFGCLSFHETKNIQCGEGGALLINDASFSERAEIIREKGSDRSKFLRGGVDKYTWVDLGSSYLPSELNAAFLFSQLEHAEEIIKQRRQLWEHYFELLTPLSEKGLMELPYIPDGCCHNGHIFYIKLKDVTQRQNLIDYLRDNGIQTVFHYIPLHSSNAGNKYGFFHGEDRFTTIDSERLLRLPIWYGMTEKELAKVVKKVFKFLFN